MEHPWQGEARDCASSSLSRGSAGTGRRLQDSACNFGGKLRDGGFDIATSSGKFSRDAHFRGADFARGFRARFLDLCGAPLEKFLASGLLLGIHLAARLLEGLLVLLDLLGSRSLGSFRRLLRPPRPRIPPAPPLQPGPAEKCPVD